MNSNDAHQQQAEDGPSNVEPNDCNVFQSTRFRRTLQDSNELDQFLLDYGRYFLWPFSCFLYTILFIKEIFY